MVFPTHLEIGWTLIGGALLTSALAELNQRWPGPLEAVAGLVRHRLPIRREGPFMPLPQAARELYEANINGLLGKAARQDPGGGAEPLLWCCYWIAPRFPEIYGRRTPSTVLERVPPVLFTYARFQDGGSKLTGGDEGDFIDLCVRRNAFRAALPGLGEVPPMGPG